MAAKRVTKKSSIQSTQSSSSMQDAPKQKSGAPIGLAIVLAIVFAILLIIVAVPIFFIAVLSSDGPEGFVGTGDVAHITISGTILTSTQTDIFGGSSDTSSTKIVKQLKDIAEDDSIKGVVFEINSPGGSGVASDEIAQAIKQLNKPTVSYIREVGASGSYWVASATDYIYSNRFSTVGSIGVIASYLDFSEFIEDYNVSYQRFVAGENKDFGSPFREVTPDQEARFQDILDQLHGIFIDEVAQGRGLDRAQVVALADGGIYTGLESVNLGLVDAIGGKDEAVAYMEEELGQEVELVSFVESTSIFDMFGAVMTQHGFFIGKGIGSVLDITESITFRT